MFDSGYVEGNEEVRSLSRSLGPVNSVDSSMIESFLLRVVKMMNAVLLDGKMALKEEKEKIEAKSESSE